MLTPNKNPCKNPISEDALAEIVILAKASSQKWVLARVLVGRQQEPALKHAILVKASAQNLAVARNSVDYWQEPGPKRT